MYASATIFYRSARTLPQKISIPFDYSRNQFCYDHLGRPRDGAQRRRQREAHAETTDEYPGIFERAPTGTGEFGQRFFGVVRAAVHQIARHTGNTNRKIVIALRQGQFCIATRNSGTIVPGSGTSKNRSSAKRFTKALEQATSKRRS